MWKIGHLRPARGNLLQFLVAFQIEVLIPEKQCCASSFTTIYLNSMSLGQVRLLAAVQIKMTSAFWGQWNLLQKGFACTFPASHSEFYREVSIHSGRPDFSVDKCLVLDMAIRQQRNGQVNREGIHSRNTLGYFLAVSLHGNEGVG